MKTDMKIDSLQEQRTDLIREIQSKVQSLDTDYALRALNQTLAELNSTSTGRRAFMLSIPLLLTACATSSKHRMREGDNTGQETAITVADEKKMTQEYLPQMAKEYPAHPNPEAQKYITELGNRIIASNGLAGNPYNYTFTVVQSKSINAFALPAGTVFVTAPLIGMADSEAELAGVVGHEIGHIKARHTAERIDKAKKEQSKSLLYGLGGLLVGAGAGYGLGKLLCRKNDKKCLQRAAMYGAAAGGAGGLLIQKFAFMANSREDEMEADRIGFRTSVAAGYDKDHVGLFYSKLLKMEQKHKSGDVLGPVADAMSTHPPSQERVNQMSQMAQLANGRGRTVNTPSFDRVKRLVS